MKSHFFETFLLTVDILKVRSWQTKAGHAKNQMHVHLFLISLPMVSFRTNKIM